MTRALIAAALLVAVIGGSFIAGAVQVFCANDTGEDW